MVPTSWRNVRLSDGTQIGIGVDASQRIAYEESLRQAERESRERKEEAEQRRYQVEQLARELTTAEQRERKRLAQVLHDRLQQVIVAARMNVEMAQRLGAGEEQEEVLAEVVRMLNEATKDSRALAHTLAPPVLAQGGLVAALPSLVEHKRDYHQLEIEVELGAGELEPGDETLRVFVHQSLRELLLNVTKHAGVSQAVIMGYREGEELVWGVRDEGAGFDATDSRGGEGFGLHSIKERLEILGGRLHIQSAPGEGCRVEMHLPVMEEAE